MTAEATVTKLAWILAQTNDLEKIRALMEKNLAGEMSVGSLEITKERAKIASSQ